KWREGVLPASDEAVSDDDPPHIEAALSLKFSPVRDGETVYRLIFMDDSSVFIGIWYEGQFSLRKFDIDPQKPLSLLASQATDVPAAAFESWDDTLQDLLYSKLPAPRRPPAETPRRNPLSKVFRRFKPRQQAAVVRAGDNNRQTAVSGIPNASME